MSKELTIQLPDEQYEALIATGELTITNPAIKWQPKGGSIIITNFGTILYQHGNQSIIDFGMAYPSKEKAEYARKHIKKFNRYISWLTEQNVNDQQGNYTVELNIVTGLYEVKEITTHKNIFVPTMDLATAELTAASLNNNTLIL